MLWGIKNAFLAQKIVGNQVVAVLACCKVMTGLLEQVQSRALDNGVMLPISMNTQLQLQTKRL